MITITLQVPDAEHAEEVVKCLMQDGMMYLAMPLTMKVEDYDDADTVEQRVRFIEQDLDLGSNTMYSTNARLNMIEE